MITPEARRMYADEFRTSSRANRNLALSIEAGQHDHSFWARPALLAIDRALRYGAPDVESTP